MKRFIIIISLLIIAFSVSAAKLKPDSKLVKGKLNNGMTYYIYPNDYPKGEAVFRLFIKSGSVFEEDTQKGLAHFLEHMAFNGTKNFPGNAIVKYLESKGAKFGKDLNAHTSFNETVYKLQLPTSDKAFVDSALMILADWAGGLLLDSLEIDKERGVIYSEWLSKTGPEKEIQEAFLMDILNNSRYKDRIVIGDTAVIMNFPHKVLRDYYQKWYHPSLMAIAVSGDVDVKEMEKNIKKKFSAIVKPAIEEAPVYGIPDYEKENAKILVHESLSKIEFNRMQLLPLLPAVVEESDYPAYLRQVIVNRLMKARLSSLTFENQPYSNPSVSISGFLNTKGILLASAELIPNKIDTGITTFTYHLEQMFRYGFINSEISKVKKSYLSSLERSVKSKNPVLSESFMNQLYSDFYKGDAMISPAAEYKLARKYISNIDSTSIVEYFKATVDNSKTHYLMSAFSKVKEELPDSAELLALTRTARESNVTPFKKDYYIPENLLENEPKAGKINEAEQLPDIKSVKLKLSNGSTVIFKRSETKKSQLTISGFRKGGQYSLNPEDYVSSLYAGGIISLSGAGEFSRDALNHYLAGNTASVRFLIDKTRSGLAGNADLKDKETLFKLLYLKWTEPRVDTALYNQTREKAIENYLTANKTDVEKFNEELSYLMVGKNYTNRELTDSLIINELSMEKFLPVFNKVYGSAEGYTFIITADCELQEVKPLIEKYLGGLPSGKSNTAYIFKGPEIPQEYVAFEKKVNDSPKATVMMVFQNQKVEGSMNLNDLKNDMAKDVLRVKLLGELREKLGMVYSVGVSSGSTKHPSKLNRRSVSFSCLPENVDLLCNKTMEQITDMVNNPSGFEQELKDVKTNLVKAIMLDKQKDSFWSTYIRNSIFNGDTNWSFIKNYEDIVNSITTKDIAAIFEEAYLKTPAIKAVMYPKDSITK